MSSLLCNLKGCCSWCLSVVPFAGWGLPLVVPLLTWTVFQKVATFFLMTRYTSNHNIYVVSIHCWVLEKFSQQFSISIFTRNSPTQDLITLRLWRLSWLAVEWLWLVLAGPFLTLLAQCRNPLPSPCISGTIGSFQSGGAFGGWRALTIESLLISMCGQCHEPPGNGQLSSATSFK